MKNIKRILSLLLMSSMITSFGTNSIAYGDSIEPMSQSIDQKSEAIFESLEITNSIGTMGTPISMKIHGSNIKSVNVYFLLEDNHDQGVPITFELKEGEWVANHVVYMENLKGTFYLSRIDIVDHNDIGKTYYNSGRYTPEQFDALNKYPVYVAEPRDFSAHNIEVKGGYGSHAMNQNSEVVFESLEITNAIGTRENPISMKINGSNIMSANAWFLLKDNHDRGIPISFELRDGVWVANHFIYQEAIRGEYYLSHLDLVDGKGIGKTFYNENQYTFDQFDSRNELHYAVPENFSAYNIEVSGVYGGYNPEVTVAIESKKLTTNDMLNISIEVDESDVKIDYVFATYVLEGSDYSFQQRLERNPDGKFAGQRKISEYHKSGNFSVKFVSLFPKDYPEGIDITHSFDTSRYEVTQDLSSGFFTVSGTKTDNTAPEFISLKEKDMVAVPGEETSFELSIKEEESLMNFGHVMFLNEDGKEVFGIMSFEGDKGFIKIDTPAEYIELGTYKIFRLVLEDNAGNRNLYFNSEINEYRDDVIMLDLSGYTLTYIDKEEVKPLLNKIEIKTSPETYYFQGEDLDLSNLVVEGIYDNGERAVLTIPSENVTGYNKKLVGQQTITITYKNIKTTFIVLVKDPSMKISISEENVDSANVVFNKDDLAQIDIPEVMDPSVKSVEIKLNVKILDENKIGTYINDVKDSTNILALYDLNLVKIIEYIDGLKEEKNLIDESFEGMLTLRIEVPEKYQDLENLVAVHVSENGTVEELKTESKIIDGIRYLYFETNHFSLYGIAEVNLSLDEEQPVDTEDDKETSTPDAKEEETEVADKSVAEEESLPKAGSVSNNLLNITGISFMLGGLFFLRKEKVVGEKNSNRN